MEPYPGGGQNTKEIYECIYTALAEELAKSAQENCGKSDSEQFKNNVEILAKFIKDFGADAVNSFIVSTKATLGGVSKGAKTGHGNLLKTLTGIFRDVTQDVTLQIPITTGKYVEDVFGIK